MQVTRWPMDKGLWRDIVVWVKIEDRGGHICLVYWCLLLVLPLWIIEIPKFDPHPYDAIDHADVSLLAFWVMSHKVQIQPEPQLAEKAT